MLASQADLRERVLNEIKEAAQQDRFHTIQMHLRNYSDRQDQKLMIDAVIGIFFAKADIESILKLPLNPDDFRNIRQSGQADLTLQALLHEGFDRPTFSTPLTLSQEVLKASLQAPETLKEWFQKTKTLPPSELYWAAACRQVDEVNRLVTELRAADLPVPVSALHVAALCGHLDVVKILWSQRKPEQDPPQYAVALAALGGHFGIIDYAIEQGFPTKQALACAIHANQTEIADKVLQQQDSDVGQRDFYGRLPLALAMQQDCGVRVVPLLLNRYDDKTLQLIVNKQNLLEYSCQHGIVFAIKHLLGRNIFIHYSRMGALNYAIQSTIPTVMALLEGDNEHANLYMAALERACCSGKTELVQALLAKKDEILQKNPKLNWLILLNNCITQMSYSKVLDTHADVLALLYKAGACSSHVETRALAAYIKREDLRVALADRYHQQIKALRVQHPETYSDAPAAMEGPSDKPGLHVVYDFQFIQKNSSIDTYSRAIQSELIRSNRKDLSTYRGVLESIYYDVILPEAFNNSSVIPFLYAAQAGLLAAMKTEWPSEKEAVKLLPEALTLAGKNGHREVVNFLLEQGAEPNAQFFSVVAQAGQLEILQTVLGKTPTADASAGLAVACEKNLPQLFDALLARSRNVDEKDAAGYTALHNACHRGRTEFVRKLIAAKANLELPVVMQHSRRSLTPLMVACDSNANTTEIIDLLLAAPVDINAQNKEGETAVYYAVTNGKLELVKKLLELCPATLRPTLDGESLLGTAIQNRQEALIEFFKGKILAPDLNDLICASQRGRLDLVKFLLARFPDQPSPEQLKTLVRAAEFDDNPHDQKEWAAKKEVAQFFKNMLNPLKEAVVLQTPVQTQVETPAPKPSGQEPPKPATPKFETDPRFTAMQTWIRKHFTEKSSIFEINSIKHKLLNAVLTQLGQQDASKSTQELMNTAVKVDPTTLGLNKSQLAILKRRHGVNLENNVNLSEIAAIRCNRWSRGFTDTTLYFLQGANFHISQKQTFLAYLTAVDHRLASARNISSKTREKMLSLFNAVSQINEKSDLNGATLQTLLQTKVTDHRKKSRTVAEVLGDHRMGFGVFKTRSIRDLKRVFKSQEVDQALKTSKPQR